MKPLAGALILLALAPGEPPASGDATLRDRVSWNARERTAAGSRALASGDTEGAAAAFDAARRLRPEDPRTGYNAGTARIGTEDETAEALLSAAAGAAGPELAPAAWYNLGTARLASGDARGAIEALSEALRRAPADLAAKQNLEIALDEIQRQETEEQRQNAPPGSEGEPQQQRRSDEGDGGEDESEDESEDGRDGASSPAVGEPPRSDGDEPTARNASPGSGTASRQDPLPRFKDLPDMTAEQAAAILRSVEDLERQQRRERARRAAAERAAVEVDW